MGNKRRRAILAAVLALVLLFLVLHVVLEAEHDCHGDDCAICARLHTCVELLRSLALTLVLALTALAACGLLSKPGESRARVCRRLSLVSLKVKLSD